ncbi:hypothetical protein ACTG9Q_01725 [Actinokineospora sp. 24-640]
MRRERTATRRLLSRALLVLGGAAAAWAVSAGTAAADAGAGLPRDLGVAIEAAPTSYPVLTEGTAAVADLVGDVAHVLRSPVDPVIEDGANSAVREVAQKLSHTTPGQQVDTPLPLLPDLSPLPDSAAADGPHAVAPEIERPVAVSAAEAQRHGEPVASALSSADADTITKRGPPETSSQAPVLPSGPRPLAPLSVPAPAPSGHSGTGAGDAPHSGLLSTVPAATEPAVVRTPHAARVDVPATVDAQPGVTPD